MRSEGKCRAEADGWAEQKNLNEGINSYLRCFFGV